MASTNYRLARISLLRRRSVAILFWATTACFSSCRKAEQLQVSVVQPLSTVLHDRTFHSEALGSDVTYGVIEPASIRADKRNSRCLPSAWKR